MVKFLGRILSEIVLGVQINILGSIIVMCVSECISRVCVLSFVCGL